MCGECAVKSLFSIKQAFEDPENVLVSWDPNYLSPCTFAFVECDDNNSVSGLYVATYSKPTFQVCKLGKHLTMVLLDGVGSSLHMVYLEACRL